jgi:hypothetical protein
VHTSARTRRRLLVLTVAAVVIAVAGFVAAALQPAAPRISALAAPGPATAAGHTVTRLTDPPRTVVADTAGVPLATLTDGARTAAVVGPARTFTDPTAAAAPVTLTTWVRLLPQPWASGDENAPWFGPWLDAVVADRSPDVLAIATQYVGGAPAVRTPAGGLVAGDAGFGPPDGSASGRAADADFYDYLGAGWTFADGRVEAPDPTRAGDVDSAGFLRLVWGYRLGLPVSDDDRAGGDLPRHARAMAETGPGSVVISDQGRPAVDYSHLQPGDLVFFAADGDRPDHAGIYLGPDASGAHRFLSSRAAADGPTFGDVGGPSVLDDGKRWSQAFRSARRL